MTAIDTVGERLTAQPLRWLVTGSAGFIGSHLVQRLLELDQTVVGLDNFATGHRRNLDDVRAQLNAERWNRHRFVEADIRDAGACRLACRGVDIVLHQAALGSVPRSIADPVATHGSNVDGFLNMLVAARDAGVRRFVYASSSSVYGDHPALPKVGTRSAGRCRRTPRRSSSTSSMRTSSHVVTSCRRSAFAISTSSARGRIPMARMPRWSPAGFAR